MKVSVIVPVYNQARYLKECIDSILAQTYTDLDIVLVDDGSTDGSATICDEYAQHDQRITVIHQHNAGLAAARNRGVAAAKGDYVLFVDSDDMVRRDAVASLVSCLEQTGATGVIGAMSHKLPLKEIKNKAYTITARQAIAETLYQYRINNSLCGKLLPTKAVQEAKQPESRWYEDLDTFYRIYEILDGDIAVTPDQLYYYRPNPDSFINSYTHGRLHVLDVTQRIESHYASDSVLSRAARDRRFSANYSTFILTSKYGDQDVADRCWQVVREYRREALLDPKVRLKNKIGALMSYLGRGTVLLTAKLTKA